ncbi:MAG TPA: glutamate synthase subunit beta [Spirochaetota bacterium]|nr:glutamate synthase subunit beta [Spirochaetota bacterium]HPJ13619.1 glutamate synthase subunit beta [Spirochaetota bacterium]HPM34973.1 glutamate synthase subunit beta [Spirochaetota bacterium]
MGDPTGFLKNNRKVAGYRPVEQRINDYSEVELQLSEDERKLQASRCMDCGVPFCHWSCPVSNIMPEWQDRIFKGEWKEAWELLQETNNFPEFTGRVCPALCEASCVLALNDEAVTIRQNELAVIEKAFELGLVKANPPKTRSGKKVAVIGGGPAGLAAADQLNKAGHMVTLFEGTDRVGGYLRYGIPDFKLEKSFIDRRLDIMKEEGVVFKTNSYVGRDVKINDIMKEYDAVCITIGAREARDLPIEGRELSGIHQALDYLTQQNKTCAGDKVCQDSLIAALDKNVLVIGGGDTGSDCVGTANRQGARKVTQIELLPMPSKTRTDSEPWPLWPRLHKTSSSHEEGCERLWCISSKKFIGENGKVKKVLACKVEWVNENGRFNMKEVPGSEFEIEADLVLLAMGFVHVVQKDFVNELGLKLDARGNIDTGADFKTSVDKVFAAGDANRGASLVVYAISEGRGAANAINEFLSK